MYDVVHRTPHTTYEDAACSARGLHDPYTRTSGNRTVGGRQTHGTYPHTAQQHRAEHALSLHAAGMEMGRGLGLGPLPAAPRLTRVRPLFSPLPFSVRRVSLRPSAAVSPRCQAFRFVQTYRRTGARRTWRVGGGGGGTLFSSRAARWLRCSAYRSCRSQHAVLCTYTLRSRIHVI